MRQHAHTRYSMELDDGETLPIPFEIDPATAVWKTSPDGLTGYLGAMVIDEDAADPIEDFDNGELVVFDHSKKHSADRPEIDEFKRIIRANPGRVVTFHLYEHSLIAYKLAAGPFTVADTKGIRTKHGHHTTSPAEAALADARGYYIIPDDATDPKAYAAAQLQEYTNWANCEVYGAWCWRYTRPDMESEWELDESSRDSECWGYIGYDYACSERDDRIKEAMEADQTTTPES